MASGLLLLAGCSTVTYHQAELNDKIYNLVVPAQNAKPNQIYAVGGQQDYELTLCPAYTKPRHEVSRKLCLRRVDFIRREMEQSRVVFTAPLMADVYGNQIKNGAYSALVKLTPQEMSALQITPFHGADLSDTVKHAIRKAGIPPNELAWIVIDFSGRVVKLDNRRQILAQSKLREPLLFKLTLNNKKRRFHTPKEMAQGVVGLVGFTLFVPVAVVIGGVCEISGCADSK